MTFRVINEEKEYFCTDDFFKLRTKDNTFSNDLPV